MLKRLVINMQSKYKSKIVMRRIYTTTFQIIFTLNMLYMLSKSILTFFSSFSPTHRQPFLHTQNTHSLFLFKNFSLFSSRFGSSSSNYLGLILLNLIYFKLKITLNIFRTLGIIYFPIRNAKVSFLYFFRTST